MRVPTPDKMADEHAVFAARLTPLLQGRPILFVATLLVAALTSGSAGAQVPIGLVPKEVNSSQKVQTVPYVTARAVERNNTKVFDYYGSRRGGLSAGECTVDLRARKSHEVIGLQARDLGEIVDRPFAAEGRVVVYVHGYNMSFEDACRRAALFQYNVRLEQRLLLFSWPADAKVMRYVGDIGDVEWSVLPLKTVLLMLIDRYGPKSVDVIGHSLGARAVFDAATAVAAARGAGTLGRVILIAPDVDADVFVRDYAAFGEAGSATSVYVSQQDRALKASRNVSHQLRLGEGATDLSALPRLDVVTVIQWRWMWGSHHDYHLNDSNVVSDLEAVLSGPPHLLGSRTIGD
jgi:esterase/lipase superfamily enzyme